MSLVWESARIFAPFSDVSNLFPVVESQGRYPWSDEIKLVMERTHERI